MSDVRMCCTVVYATAARQFLWAVELAPQATVADAIAAARADASDEAAPWDSAVVGVFGEACRLDRVLREGDRVEIYRPLADDPRVRRRKRARHFTGSGGGSSAF